MVRTKSGDKPKAIRAATIGEVAEVGSTAVSVNKIAKRADLSVGTLYRYHATKDDLLFWVFKQVKSDIHDAMMTAARGKDGAAQRLRAMWFALVEYGFAAPRDFLFAEMMSAEIRDGFQEDLVLKQMQSEVLAEIQAGIDSEVLVHAPVRTLEIILASPAITLARRASIAGVEMEKRELDRVFDLVWRGIAQVEPTKV
ncbi:MULTISPECIES: TetR/AcrR family transcriptional regulator [Halocynthiibacter]|uniref:TetR/AcrR family transcriptional regulator n=1 Tax=Halocynthiibacter halioticoli TaxID=2986804 RepID=A0AAE3J0U2_9RHOB|nr:MULTISPECIES: TetR/AcrR family transcriptional regulator [Halocynthiibacter]MCV6825670.1 TetR/AcrR family transcriptional regulator [Halocynthiibacter halioticoli]MCW4058671.1 TetR/AcrR family transcriptional regulator [Halocynthiibacter sp. SDUM655004]